MSAISDLNSYTWATVDKAVVDLGKQAYTSRGALYNLPQSKKFECRFKPLIGDIDSYTFVQLQRLYANKQRDVITIRESRYVQYKKIDGETFTSYYFRTPYYTNKIHEYGIEFYGAIVYTTDNEFYDEATSSENTRISRSIKNRIVYHLGFADLHLTESTKVEKKDVTYEVSLRYIVGLSTNFRLFLREIDQVFKVINSTTNVYSLTDYTRVANIINSVTPNKSSLYSNAAPRINTEFFIRPRNLKVEDVTCDGLGATYTGISGKRDTYTISQKIDGTRKIAVFLPGEIWFVGLDSTLDFYRKTSGISTKMIVDGELMNVPIENFVNYDSYSNLLGIREEAKSVNVFAAFDLILQQKPGTNALVFNTEDHKRRLLHLSSYLSTIPRGTLLTCVKPFMTFFDYKVFYSSLVKLLNAELTMKIANAPCNAEFKAPTDGIIFMPSNLSYEKIAKDPKINSTLDEKPTIVKYKEWSKMTIDVHLSVDKSGEYRMTYTPGGEEFNPTTLEMKNFSIADHSPNDVYEVGPKLEGDRIVLSVIRKRTDKKAANSREVINAIWKDIQNPVTLDMLSGKVFSLFDEACRRIVEQIIGKDHSIVLLPPNTLPKCTQERLEVPSTCFAPDKLLSRVQAHFPDVKKFRVVSLYTSQYARDEEMLKPLIHAIQTLIDTYNISFSMFTLTNSIQSLFEEAEEHTYGPIKISLRKDRNKRYMIVSKNGEPRADYFFDPKEFLTRLKINVASVKKATETFMSASEISYLSHFVFVNAMSVGSSEETKDVPRSPKESRSPPSSPERYRPRSPGNNKGLLDESKGASLREALPNGMRDMKQLFKDGAFSSEDGEYFRVSNSFSYNSFFHCLLKSVPHEYSKCLCVNEQQKLVNAFKRMIFDSLESNMETTNNNAPYISEEFSCESYFSGIRWKYRDENKIGKNDLENIIVSEYNSPEQLEFVASILNVDIHIFNQTSTGLHCKVLKSSFRSRSKVLMYETIAETNRSIYELIVLRKAGAVSGFTGFVSRFPKADS
jgi:hypothetical protein